jgi:hypothetical protein
LRFQHFGSDSLDDERVGGSAQPVDLHGGDERTQVGTQYRTGGILAVMDHPTADGQRLYLSSNTERPRLWEPGPFLLGCFAVT